MRNQGSYEPSRRCGPRVTAAGFAVLGASIYAPALGAFFLSDDFDALRALREGGPFGLWTHDGRFFRPLASLSLFADFWMWGLSAPGFHGTSWTLHVANALLVALLAARSSSPVPGRRWPPVAVLAGSIFLAHPSHGEAVAWVSSRGDLLVTFFALLALLGLLRHLRSSGAGSLCLVGAALVGAMSAKEAALVLPWILLLWWRARKETGAGWRGLPWVLALAPIVYVLVRGLFVGGLIGAYGASIHLDFAPHRLLGPLFSYPIRSLLPPLARQHAFAAAGVLGILVFASIGFVRRRRAEPGDPDLDRCFLLLAGSFALACLPVANLGVSLLDSQGERFLYLPTVFSSLALAFLCERAFRRRALLLAGSALVLSMAISTAQTSATWAEAGDIARRLVNEATSPDLEGGALLVNLPDNLRGAYVFRNGFEAAAELFGKGARPPIPLARTAPPSAAARAEARRREESLTLFVPGCRSLRPAIRPSRRSSFTVLADPDRVAVLHQADCTLELTLGAELLGRPLYVLTGGRLERVH